MVDRDSLSYIQLKWLDSKGGRDNTDILVDEQGYYIEMQGRNLTINKVYLPKPTWHTTTPKIT